MAQDPICGMTVDETKALRSERDGKIFYFCGEHCRQKFFTEPGEIAPPPAKVLRHSNEPSSVSVIGSALRLGRLKLRF